MSVWVNLKSHKAKATVQSDGRMVKTYTETYLYRTNAGSIPTDADIAADVGVAPGSPYGGDANATAGDAEIEFLMTRVPWFKAEVTITWSTKNPVPNEDDTDPSTVRVLWDLRSVIQQRYIVKDRLGKLIVNTAGQPFDGGTPVDVRLGQVAAKLKVAYADFNKNTMLANNGKLNTATYLGAAAGTLQMDATASEAVEGGYHFYNVEYVFTYDPLGHQPRPANVGFYQLLFGTLAPITVGDLTGEIDGTKVTEPEPIDIDGHVVPYADRPDSCIFVPVDYFDTLNYSTGLPGL